MNKGVKAGCGISSCGCLLVVFAIPIAIIIALAINDEPIKWPSMDQQQVPGVIKNKKAP